MSILGNNTLPLSPPSPSKEQLLKQVVNRITSLSKEYYNNSIRVQREGIKLVFDNPDLEPQEILDALAPHAPKIMIYHGMLSDFISNVANIDGSIVDLKYPTNSFTMNLSAGTVTLTNEPYQV